MLASGSLLLPVGIMASTPMSVGADAPTTLQTSSSSLCAAELEEERDVNCDEIDQPQPTVIDHSDEMEKSEEIEEDLPPEPTEPPTPDNIKPAETVGHAVKALGGGAPPQLTIVKQTDPATDAMFDFTSDSEEIGDFSLSGGGGSETFTGLSESTVRITEDVTEGWEFEDVICVGAFDWSQEGGTATISVELHRDDDVTCTFTNIKKEVPPPPKKTKITGFKFHDKNGDGHFDDSERKLPGWTMTLFQKDGEHDWQELDSVETDEEGNFAFTELEVGDFKVCETQKAGWINTAPGDGSLCRSGTTMPHEPLVFKFGNKKKEIPPTPPVPPAPPTPPTPPTPPAPPAPTPPQPQVLGAMTFKSGELVDTGVGAAANIVVGGAIASALALLHLLRPRRVRQTIDTQKDRGISPRLLLHRISRIKLLANLSFARLPGRSLRYSQGFLSSRFSSFSRLGSRFLGISKFTNHNDGSDQQGQ